MGYQGRGWGRGHQGKGGHQDRGRGHQGRGWVIKIGGGSTSSSMVGGERGRESVEGGAHT